VVIVKKEFDRSSKEMSAKVASNQHQKQGNRSNLANFDYQMTKKNDFSNQI